MISTSRARSIHITWHSLLAGIAWLAYSLHAFQTTKSYNHKRGVGIIRLQLSAPTVSDHAPTWDSLRDQILSTATGSKFAEEDALRNIGRGPPNTNAALRLFAEEEEEEEEEENVRVTLYRDHAAWCPYCQKVWLFLELKQIPFRCERVPLNAYGDKPAWFTRKVDGGKLPALELDGELFVESLNIIQLLEEAFPDHGPTMIPSMADTSLHKQYQDLLQLEQELQRAWFSLTFYPVEGEALGKANQTFHEVLSQVDSKLAQSGSDWFLGGDSPSLVDLQFITQVERIIPSVLYWKGVFIRDNPLFPNLNRWLKSLESLPAYLASRCDYYTHIMAITSQNGPGYLIPEAKSISNQISGLLGAWQHPFNFTTCLEHFPELSLLGADYNPAHEAAYKVIYNHANIVAFACRGAGEPGTPSFHAELADPYAEPNEEFRDAVDISLRHLTHTLIHGEVSDAAKNDLQGKGGSGELRDNWEAYPDETDESLTYYWNYETGDVTWTPPTRQLDTCLAYLRDRVGVPRDTGPAAAMQLRAHLNLAIELMRE